MEKQQALAQRKILRAVEANMRAEGFTVSAKVKKDCREMLSGKVTANTLVDRYASLYRK